MLSFMPFVDLCLSYHISKINFMNVIGLWREQWRNHRLPQKSIDFFFYFTCEKKKIKYNKKISKFYIF